MVFINKKKVEIINAKFKVKSQIMLEISVSKDFKGCRMTIEDKSIMVMQKKQTKKLFLINIKDNTKK